MDKEQVSFFQLWKFSAFCKFIIVFTKRTDNVIDFRLLRIFLPEHGNMVIGIIDGRSHQIRCTGIHTRIMPIGILKMYYLCD